MFICFVAFHIKAQQAIEKNIEVGMLVKITSCPKGVKSFESMDIYRKTRIPEKINIDSVTGEGIFENFFNVGDFDAKRLPCEYGNKKYKVAALQIFDDEKTNTQRRIMILYTSDPLALIWVEFDKAVELKEVEF